MWSIEALNLMIARCTDVDMGPVAVYGFPLLDLCSNVGTTGAMLGSAVGHVTRLLKSEIESYVFEVEIPSDREPNY